MSKLTMEGVKHFVKKNAPTLLMGAGIGCYAGATAFTIYGTVKSCKKVSTEQILRATSANPDGDRVVVTIDEKNGVAIPDNAKLAFKDKARMCWKYYIPSALFFAGGTALIITANHMQLMRIELLGAALVANNKKFDEYKERVKGVFGDDAQKKISENKSQEMVFSNPPPAMPLGNGVGALCCMDSYTGQYFWSTRHVIDQAILECERIYMQSGRVSVNDLLYRLGCNEAGSGNEAGWDSNDYAERNKGAIEPLSSLIKLDYVQGPNGEPVLVLQYDAKPFVPF